MSTDQIPVWLDCDPGHDDAFAILLAAYHPRIKLLGISTVFGNAPLSRTTHNAASILTSIAKHKDIPLHRGAAKALERPAVHAPDVHGESGLDGTDLLPEPECTVSPVPAVDAMVAALSAQPKGTAWIVATGSMTNVGDLIRRHKSLVTDHINGVSIMGGSFGDNFSGAPLGRVDNAERIGNITEWAEFNILIDPEAANELFADPAIAAKTTVVPLDLSHLVRATDDVRQALLFGTDPQPTGVPEATTGKTKLRTMLVELLYFFAKTYAEIFGITDGPPLHDPIAVAAVLIGTPDEISFVEWEEGRSQPPKHNERFQVTVVTDGTYEDAKAGNKQTGRTIAKLLPPGQAGVRIPRSMDVPKFWKVIEECVARADEANKALGR